MKFEISRVQGAPASDEELLADLKNAAKTGNVSVLSQNTYSKFGIFNPSTVIRRFGSWNKAVLLAGLRIANEINIPDDRLFENIMTLWEHYGRQPRRAELASAPSRISMGAYRRRFLSWMAALNEFVSFANEKEVVPQRDIEATTPRKGQRDPSLRMRFRVMKRDKFSCRTCGASPARFPGTLLHVDHVVPWSLGGPTIDDNLQTLCERCNLGKGNVL